MPIPHETSDRFRGRASGVVRQPQRTCHRRRYQLGDGYRGQVDEPHSFGEIPGEFVGELYRESGLARPANPGECDESVFGDRLA